MPNTTFDANAYGNPTHGARRQSGNQAQAYAHQKGGPIDGPNDVPISSTNNTSPQIPQPTMLAVEPTGSKSSGLQNFAAGGGARLPVMHGDDARLQQEFESARVPSAVQSQAPSLPRGRRFDMAPSTDRLDDPPDNSDVLKALRNHSLQEISRKQYDRKRGPDKSQTTSLRDLELARRPPDPRRAPTSMRPWGQVPLTDPSEVEQDQDSATPTLDGPPQLSQPQPAASETAPMPSSSLPQPPPGGSKWASRAEMKAEKPEKPETDSNAWGSAVPSDATRESNISEVSFGKMLNRHCSLVEESPLADWEGNIAPPPADWAERPRYNNNNDDFRGRFKQWQAKAHAETQDDASYRFSNGVPYCRVSPDQLKVTTMVPDGISYVSRLVSIDLSNAHYYGYIKDPEDAVKYAQSVQAQDYDFDWGKLDPTDEENVRFKNETTNDLVNGWLGHMNNINRAADEAGLLNQADSKAVDEETKPVASIALEEPKLNIYLRPATKCDLEELTRIYNLHIVGGVGPPETREITRRSMDIRLQDCKNCRFPFIVAAKRKQKAAKRIQGVDDEELSGRMGLPVTHKKPATLTHVEMLAGFCCAQDITTSDYVERTSAEIELYVDPAYKRMGVGKCLIDKMLEILDRSHRRTTSCAFHCDRDIRHAYSAGGERNVHKLYFLLRKWHTPKPAMIDPQRERRPRRRQFTKTPEDDSSQWLRKWLESMGFEVEGFLKKVGAKNGRYIDLLYLGRETAWQPAEGDVPDPDPRDVVDGDDDDDDDDGD